MTIATSRRGLFRTSALAGALALSIAGSTAAQERVYSIPAQPLAASLRDYGIASGEQIIFAETIVSGRQAPALQGAYQSDEALHVLLADSGLVAERASTGGFMIRRANDPQSSGAAGDGADGTVEALIVTAQKREEDIQDVPIAISAFTQETLERSQVAGGPDLMTQVPNMTFTKTNFSSYSIQIRGIGTQAISATTDPAVAVAFNNTPFVRNRFFEQEFYDLERLEVLRGPQGTLYGRNATAGVVNLISAKPTFNYDSKLSADIGNYGSTRLEGMINLPLVEDVVALRIAGAWTKRDGYSTNQITGNPIDGRDLWSTRVSLRIAPTDRLSANLIYEHFEEDDDRLRSGKQVCKKDPGPSEIGGLPVPLDGGGFTAPASYVSQGCLPASMYAAESYQTPNGYALPFYGPTGNLANAVFPGLDPYLSTTQSRDLRVIESMVDPKYRARTNVAELQVRYELTDSLTLDSETAYSADTLFSLQDYNRFNTKSGVFDANNIQRVGVVDANGVFCDPQIGCSDRLVLLDLSTAKSTQFSQEFRISSNFDGPLNFSLGANYLRYDTEDKYYVFVNSLSMFAAQRWGFVPNDPYIPGVTDNSNCQPEPGRRADPTDLYGITGCIYIDPNPIGSLNDQGRNYFLSKNPYRLISYAGFGEIYYQVADSLKLTAGLRWTVDKKYAPSVPSWLLATGVGTAAGVGGDYPVAGVVDQKWGEPTGRLAIDWKPDLRFSDETLLYASYAHGYKAGGANPPPPVVATYSPMEFDDSTVAILQSHPRTFDAEYVDAFEAGAKNTLFDGRMTLNLGAFYYDYQGYQVSQIINRSAVNLNFDAEIWGLEVETDWRPVDNLRFGFKGGYQNTRLADGSGAIDVMDRTAGHEDWSLVKPFPTIPSNCILPDYVLSAGGQLHVIPAFYQVSFNGICVDAYYSGVDPLTQLPYVANPTEELGSRNLDGTITKVPLKPEYLGYVGFDPRTAPNGGAGFTKDLSGNELPNAPHFTATLTADYTLPLPHDWLATLHSDLYYQSEAWTRVFNTEGYDKLKAYTNVNVAAIFTNEDAGWKVMAYVKNVFDRDSITGAFLNSDDTGLTTNVFLTEPRLYGLRVTKDFTGSLFGWMPREPHDAQEPYPMTVEFGGVVGRFGADAARYTPAWTPSDLASALSAQDYDPDWGDVRDIRMTYAPGQWRVSAGFMYGKTNGQGRAASYQTIPGIQIYIGPYPILYLEAMDNQLITAVRGSEEFETADFRLGRDIGLGALGGRAKSTLSFGLRYASLQSQSGLTINGVNDSFVDPALNLFSGERRYDAYAASIESGREFTGAGPALWWNQAVRLAGDANGHLDLEWELGAAVLFGEQTADVTGHVFGAHHDAVGGFGLDTVTVLYDEPLVVAPRSRDATVPTASLNLGLAYEVDRIKLSTGYRYDRFFDAIDGGITMREQRDRTIDGPYFKLAIGFGG